jgi:hypothetical protein
LNELDVVRLTVDLPSARLRRGAIGTIVHVFHHPDLAYELEFVDRLGRTRAQVTVQADQIEPAGTAPRTRDRGAVTTRAAGD